MLVELRALAQRMTESVPADETCNEESPAAHNQEVARGLKEYCHFPHSQGFAVMLSGPWGSGKTHFIKALLDQLVPPGKAGERTSRCMYRYMG
jgi:DNA replication protein DnaC